MKRQKQEGNMRNKPLIPYRPLPESNETLKGYLLRIAYENGYASLNLLGRVIDKRISPLLFRTGTSENRVLSRLLRQNLCLTPKEWTICELTNASLIQSTFAIVNYSDKRIKFCIECFKEAPLLDKKWEAIHETHCSKHNCKLQHTCPGCNKPFAENTQFFDSCPRCELRWEDICIVKSPVPSYQILDESLQGAELIRFRAALFQMLVFVVRPYDLHLATYQRFPLFILEANLEYYLSCAFAMLSSQYFAKNALERRTKLWKEMGSFKLVTPYLADFDEHLLTSIKSVSTIIPSSDDETIELPVGLDNSSHYRNSANIQQSDFYFKVGQPSIAKLLGVLINDVNDLLKEGLINDCDFVGLHNVSWFDIREIERNLNNLPIRKINCHFESKKWVNLFSLKGILERYKLSYAQSLRLMIDNNFELVSISNNWRLSDLRVCRDKAIKFFEKNFVATLDGPIRKESIQTFFHLNAKQFGAFKHLFEEQLIFDNKDFGYISGTAIKFFLENNIILNKHCKFQGINLKNCVAELKATGLLPTLPETAKSDLFIYQKSYHFEASLKAITLRLSQK
jgi:hypothetical protein